MQKSDPIGSVIERETAISCPRVLGIRDRARVYSSNRFSPKNQLPLTILKKNQCRENGIFQTGIFQTGIFQTGIFQNGRLPAHG